MARLLYLLRNRSDKELRTGYVIIPKKKKEKTYFIKIIQLIKQSIYIISYFFKPWDPRRPKLLK